MVPDFKTYIKESVWSDIHRRSNGVQVRKEDEIEHLDFDGLYDLIHDTYKFPQFPLPLKNETKDGHKYFSIGLFKYLYKIYRLTVSFKDDVIKEVLLFASEYDCKEFISILREKFNVDRHMSGALSVTSKTGEVSNRLCMDVIETVLENSSEPLLTKREN